MTLARRSATPILAGLAIAGGGGLLYYYRGTAFSYVVQVSA